jgi:hypothetical protein
MKAVGRAAPLIELVKEIADLVTSLSYLIE